MIKRVSIIVLVRCLMLGLSGILHMGAMINLTELQKFFIYFLLSGTKLSNLGLKQQLNPGVEEV